MIDPAHDLLDVPKDGIHKGFVGYAPEAGENSAGFSIDDSQVTFVGDGLAVGDEHDLSFEAPAFETNVGIRHLVETDALGDPRFDLSAREHCVGGRVIRCLDEWSNLFLYVSASRRSPNLLQLLPVA